MSGIWGDTSDNMTESSPQTSPRPQKITKCPVTGIPLDDVHDDASGSSCSEGYSISTWTVEEADCAELPSGSDVPSPSKVKGWVQQQVASFESATKDRENATKERCIGGATSPRGKSGPGSPGSPKMLRANPLKNMWSIFKGREADKLQNSPETDSTEIPADSPRDQRGVALDMIIRERHQQQQQQLQAAEAHSLHRQQRQQRHHALFRRGIETGPLVGRWLDSADPPTGLEKQEIHLTYLLLAQLFFDILFHIICLSVAAIGVKTIRCPHMQYPSTPCFLTDIVLNFAVGTHLGNAGPSEGKIQIGRLIIDEGNTSLFRALVWCIFNVAYYCAAACAITNTGSTFRRYKAFTIFAIAGIVGEAMILLEYRSALNVLIMTFRLCIFWRAWSVRHTVQDSLLLPRTPHDILDSILGPAIRPPVGPGPSQP